MSLDQRAIWDARYLKRTGSSETGEWIAQYEPYIDEMKGYTVVDLGCGDGGCSILLKKRGHHVTACDFSPVAVEIISNACPSIETRCFDMTKAFPHDIADAGIVLASLSTHYFSSDDTIMLYANIRSILKTGGYFIFRVNSKKELEIKDRPYVRRIIDRDYYELDDGTTKRYFDIGSVSKLLTGFSTLKICESSSEYHGKDKYYIECLARKL